jgi:hypothetical protein
VKEWGVFNSVRGLGNGIWGIDLEVREVLEWDCSLLKHQGNIFFEMDVEKTFMWRRGLMFFQRKHVLEFERALSGDFRRPRDVQVEDVDGQGFDEEVENVDLVKREPVPKRTVAMPNGLNKFLYCISSLLGNVARKSSWALLIQA